MEKKTVSKKGFGAKAAIGIGVGVAALSAAAYVLFGPNGKKNQKAIRGWAVKMKGEIIEEFEKTKELTESVYYDIIDKAEARYAKFKDVDKGELKATINEIKKHWIALKKEVANKKQKV